MVRNNWIVEPDYKDSCMEILAEHLLPLRMKADITQEELAQIIGVSRQTYYAIENQKREMTWNTFLSLILFFDTNTDTHLMLRDIRAYPTELMKIMAGRS